MLGWEFPPLMNGGLGVACQGLSRALASLADLTVILPKAPPSTQTPSLELIGTNTLDLERKSRLLELRSVAMVEEVPALLQPYLSHSHVPLSESDDLYGPDLGLHVLQFARDAATIADNHEFDLIHAHDWMTFLAGMEIKARTGKPLVLHVHSLQFDRAGPGARDWIFEIEKLAMKTADLVIPVSQYTGQICSNHYGIPAAKIHPVHNGVEPVRPFRSPKPFPEKLVLFLGRLTAQKGPELFLEIAARVLEQTQNATFAMAGAGEKLRGLIEYGAYQNLGDRLHFTGFLNRDEVNRLYSMTDVYCMPSVSEPFGLSALEAVQFGIPAVISRQSGVGEVLPHARIADYWDIDAMARHIVELVDDGKAHAEAVEASREDHQNCTWDHAALKVACLYDKLKQGSFTEETQQLNK